MTFRMINAIIKAYRAEQQERFKSDWERSRIVAYYSANEATIKQAKTRQKLIPLPWDEKRPNKSGFAELRKHFEALDAEMKKRNG